MKFVFSHKFFRAHFWTQFFGAFNDNLFKNAIVLLITYQSVSVFGLSPESVVALAGGIFILPFFLLSALAGQISDRFEKSNIIRYTKMTELLFMVLAAVGLLTESFGFLLFVLFLMGGQSAFFGPLKYGIVPQLVRPSELVKANAFLGGATFVAILLGTLMGGFAVSQSQAMVFTSFLIIVFALLGLLCSRFIPTVGGENPSINPDFLILPPILKLISKARKKRDIFRVILFVSWFWFLGAAVLSLIPPLAKDILYGNESVGTFFLALFTLGMGTGAAFVDRLGKHKIQLGMVAPAALMTSVALLFLGFLSQSWGHHPFVLFDLPLFLSIPASWPIVLSLFLMSVFGGIYIIPLMTFIQYQAPRGELSQFIATNNIINALTMVFAAVFVMVCYALGLNSADIIIILGVLSLVLSFIFYSIYSEETVHFFAGLIVKIFYRVEYKGVENIPGKAPFVFAANHVSYVDWLFIMGCSPVPVRFIIDNFFYRLPTAAFWFKQAHLIPITTRRSNEVIYFEAYREIDRSIKEGKVLGIFPEGAITRNGDLRRFQRGLSEIVQTHKVTVVPISLCGLWGSFLSYKNGPPSRGKFPCFRRKITVVIHPALGPDEFTLTELRNRISSSL